MNLWFMWHEWGPVLESTMWHCFRICYFKTVFSIASDCIDTSNVLCLGFHDSYLVLKMHLIVKCGNVATLICEFTLIWADTQRHTCITSLLSPTPTKTYVKQEDILKISGIP